jgi:hypothetical protein
MPIVLFGMALAIGIAGLAWERSWSRRMTSMHTALAWQAQLLAESGTACALQEALARAGSSPVKDTTAKDTTAKPKPGIADTADTICGFHRTPPGAMTWETPAGSQLLNLRATGTVTESGKPLVVSMRSTWGGDPPPDPFSPAISLWDPKSAPLQVSGQVRGGARVCYDPPTPGTVAHKSGGIQQFVPTSLSNDTLQALARMANAFRSDDAHLGGESFSPQRPPPDRDSLVYTVGDVVFDAPWTGEAWDVGRPRTLFVEGRVEFRGKLRLQAWTIYAKGPVVVQDDAELSGVDVFSTRGIRIADRARASGQFLSSPDLVVSGEARLAPPSFVACWPGAGKDSVPRFSLGDRAQADAYAVVLGPSAEIRIAPAALLRGVGVSGGTLRNDGRLEGLAVAGRLDCGQLDKNCSNGSFLRDRMPADFAYPLGLPGNRGFRLISWETGR